MVFFFGNLSRIKSFLIHKLLIKKPFQRRAFVIKGGGGGSWTRVLWDFNDDIYELSRFFGCGRGSAKRHAFLCL